MHKTFLPVCLVLCIGAPRAALAGRVSVKLVDAERGTPLEYLVKDLPLADGKTLLHYRIPQHVGVDGVKWPFDRRSGSVLAEEGGALAEFEEELGVRATASDVRSDRSTEMEAGDVVLATVSGTLADGPHAVFPGGGAFTLERDAVTAPTGALAADGDHSLLLRCAPLELNLVPFPGLAEIAKISVHEGERLVFEDSYPSYPAIALRLYLPATQATYHIDISEAGSFDLAFDGATAVLDGTPALDPALWIDVSGRVVGIGPAPKERDDDDAGAARDAGGASLELFTDRGRAVFAESEPIPLSIRARNLEADALELVLAGPDGATLRLPLPLRPCGGGLSAVEATLDPALLRPGTYTLSAELDGVTSPPLPIVVSPILPETNLKLFGMHKWTETKSYHPADLAPVAAHGLNLLVHVAGDFGTPADAAALPGASARTARRAQDAGAEFLLANGVELLPVASGLILYFNVGNRWKPHADDRNQTVQHLGQIWRRYPNFRGIVHCTGDGPTPATMGMVWAAAAGSYDIIHDDRIRALRDVFEATRGKLGVDASAMKAEFERIGGAMTGAIGFGVGMDAGMELSGDDAAKLEWIQWLNQLYPEAFRQERRALAGMIRDPIVECGRSWAPGAGGGMWEETFWRDLDHPMVDIRGDFGIMPFSYVSGADIVCAGSTQRPWIALDIVPHRTPANGLKIFLEALSRNPAGIGFYNDGANLAGNWSADKQLGESMDALLEIGRRFGDLFASLGRADEIAVVTSMRQDALAGQKAAWGAHFLASKCGWQACATTEEAILRDASILDNVKAVLLPGFTLAPPAAFLDILEGFQARGGVVVADTDSAIGLDGVVRVETAEVIFHNQVDFHDSYARFLPLFGPFEQAVGPEVPRFFGSSKRDVHLVRSVDGDLEYWTLFNDTLPNPEERSCSGNFIQFLYEGVEADLSAGVRGGTLYDALRRETVETEEADGRIRWSADLRLQPGTVYLWAPRPIASLAVAAPARAACGSTIALRATAHDGDGVAFAGRLPVEFALMDPSGTERVRVQRTTNRELSFKIAANDPAGTWRWTATDQATGLRAEGTMDVSPAAGALPAVVCRAGVACDEPAIRAALADRDFDVVVYPGQTALLGTARRLVDALRGVGAKASLRVLWPSERRRYPMNWHPFTIEDEEDEAEVLSGRAAGLRVAGKNQFGTKRDGIDCAFYKQNAPTAPWAFARDAILIGRGDVPGNPLFDHVARTLKMLPRNPSPDLPAPGDPFLAYAWAPFSFGHDAIVLFGQDAAGVEKAVDTLVGLAAEAAQAPSGDAAGRPLWRAMREDGQTYAALGLPASGGDVETVSGGRVPLPSLLPATHALRVTDAAVAKGRLAIRMEPLLDANGPAFAEIDLATGAARRFRADAGARASSAAAFSRRAADGVVPHALDLVLPDGGRIRPSDAELVALDADGTVRWRYAPFPAPDGLTEARFLRRPHRMALSKDGSHVLASFYDLYTGGSYGPANRQYNTPATVLLDAATGRERFRTSDYLATGLALADDGSRAWLADYQSFDGGRTHVNAQGAPAVAGFDSDGNALAAFRTGGAVGIATAGDGSVAAVSYVSPRRKVTLLADGRAVDVPFPRSDTGVAVSPDGGTVAVAYADAVLRLYAPDGTMKGEHALAAPGLPVYLDDGTLLCACDDGVVRRPGPGGGEMAFGDAPIDDVLLTVAALPAPILPPSPASWETLGDGIPVRRPGVPPAPDADGKVALDIPGGDGLDVFLASWRCDWTGNGTAVLSAEVAFDGGVDRYLFDLHNGGTRISLPFRGAKGGTAEIAFALPPGATLAPGSLAKIVFADFGNAAEAGRGRAGGNRNVPRLAIPNVPGFLGDPRGVEQIAYGWPETMREVSLPDIARPIRSDVVELFDGDVRNGTPLYPTLYPGAVPWMPADARAVMRSAMVVSAFESPRTVTAVGVWEHPGDRPIASFALEYTDDASEAEAGQNVRAGVAEAPGVGVFASDWNLACVVAGNRDYYHVHVLPEPVSARYWRFTVIDTPSEVQRLSELELYESAIDSLESDLGLDAGGGLDGFDALPEL
jgi:hypothetical protein